MRKRIFIAGAISADNIIDCLSNIRHGLYWTRLLIDAGYAPYPVFCDFALSLNGYISLKDYQECSSAWIRSCDAVFVIPGTMTGLGRCKSKGVRAELALAKKHKKKVFYKLEDLVKCL